MQAITVFDYLLLPIYLAFFYWRVKRMSSRLEETDLKKYIFLAFGFRMLGAIGYSLLIQYYYGYGDSLSFYDGGNYYFKEITNNPSNVTYLFSGFKESADWLGSFITDDNTFYYTASNNLMMRISAFLGFFSFNKYLIIVLCCGYFAFLGQWKLFLVFDDINKHRNRKLLAFATLCVPSIWFWSSGLLKDTFCLGAMSFLVHIFYKIFVKKKISLWDLMAGFLLGYMVFIIKSYILIIFLLGVGVMALSSFFKSIKNVVLRLALVFFTILLTVGILYEINFTEQVSDMSEKAITQIKEFQQSYQVVQDMEESSRAGVELGEFNPSINSLLLKSPLVIFTCLFRPFPWESGKLIIFLASIEAMLVFFAFVFVIFRLGLLRFLGNTFNTPHLLFCFCITLLFSLLIGFTTFNFGTIIRYKVILIPFFYFYLVNQYSNYQAQHKLKENQVP